MHVPKDVKPLWDAVGGLSWPSKMPGFAYSVPAQLCKTGGRLAAEEGTVCSGCYALKGRYLFRNVKAAMLRRYNLMRYDPKWAEKMVKLLDHPWTRKTGGEYFRWFDSGDLINHQNYRDIMDVAEALPTYKFWLPTREVDIVSRMYIQFPSNLLVRMSLPKVYEASARTWKFLSAQSSWPTGYQSAVVESFKGAEKYEERWLTPTGIHNNRVLCKARERDNFCGPCRACWDNKVSMVVYHKH